MRPILPTLLVCATLSPLPALAASYEFVPAPQTDLNRMYRVDKVTGEVTSCQYGLQESAGGIGQTVCFPAGEGAGPSRRPSMASSRAATVARPVCSGSTTGRAR